jgi:hypothetical protein
MAQAVAELNAPATRIEMAANGEQRLVMTAKTPRPEVVASLGEAAELTVVPKTWTARDEARLAAAEAARERAENEAVLAEVAALTAADAALRTEQTVALGDMSAASAFAAAFPIADTATMPAAETGVVANIITTMAAKPAPKRKQRGDTVLAATATTSKGRKAARRAAAHADVETALATSPAAPSPGSAALAAPLVASTRGFASVDLEAPAWIVASRRGAPPSSAPRIVGQSPEAERGFAGFDSDDPVLNAFAARMRGAVNDNVEVVADVAIARLESLIARLRRA